MKAEGSGSAALLSVSVSVRRRETTRSPAHLRVLRRTCPAPVASPSAVTPDSAARHSIPSRPSPPPLPVPSAPTMSTPKPSAKGKKQTPASNQKSILGFFQRKSDTSTQEPTSSPTPHAAQKAAPKKISPDALTPAPSSDPVEPSSPIRSDSKNKENGLPSPCCSPSRGADARPEGPKTLEADSPSRKVRRLSYFFCTTLIVQGEETGQLRRVRR